MLAAARVVGNMIKIAGATLGESFFDKEVGQALQMLDGRSCKWKKAHL
jgi:FKBP12-rapamycin complex-associated protein